MLLPIIVVFIISFVITFALVETIVFNLLNKWFHLDEPKFSKALKVMVPFTIIIFVCSLLVLGLVAFVGNYNPIIGSIAYLVSVIGIILFTYFTFAYFLSKQYPGQQSGRIVLIFISQQLLSQVGLSLVLGVLVLLMRFFIFEPFVLKGKSMNPTLKENDYLFITKVDRKFSYKDIVAHRNAQGSNILMHRIIGVPGDKVEIKDCSVFVNNQKLSEDYIEGDCTEDDMVLSLRKNQYFVLGDNRNPNSSLDSRYTGTIPESLIVGKFISKEDNFLSEFFTSMGQ